MEHDQHEQLVLQLKDPEALKQYAAEYDGRRPGFAARILGSLLVSVGNIVYGPAPSYEKFKAVEVIARIPYQSWESIAYTFLTAFYSDEHRAIRLAKVLPFARHAQDNETMHVVVISQIVRAHGHNGFFRHTFIPLVFSFFYFWIIWLLSLFDKRTAFELNYLFESHAFEQYRTFLEREGGRLKSLAVCSDFLQFYGRPCTTEYELFESIMIDEVIHRNVSWRMAEELAHGTIR